VSYIYMLHDMSMKEMIYLEMGIVDFTWILELR
jgi:hypothetical protein